MCYAVVLSTTSAADLSVHDGPLLRFERGVPPIAGLEHLRHPHRWYLASRAGCSCEFRHAGDPAIGFTPPLDWYPEDDGAVAATLAAVGVIRALLGAGAEVDCVDVWQGDDPSLALVPLDVDLGAVDDAAFRFFENHCFRFHLGS